MRRAHFTAKQLMLVKLFVMVTDLRSIVIVTPANCQAVKVSRKVNASQAQSLCETNSKTTPDAPAPTISQFNWLECQGKPLWWSGESEWRSGNHISISKPLWALFVDMHGPLSIRAIGRKSWHAENVFSCNIIIIITNKLRFYLCIRWIYIWLYRAILVMALLILNSLKAFDS